VDIYEGEHNLVLKLEVPGVREEDLNIQLENNTLTVQGKKNFQKEEKEENFHRIERRYGSFVRTFRLPNTVDADKIEATYDKGVLSVVLAKKAEAKPKQIKVGVSNGAKTIEG
jgi:HSP20 family protein